MGIDNPEEVLIDFDSTFKPNISTTNSLPFWLTGRRRGLAGTG
jgi:hypothetical protein